MEEKQTGFSPEKRPDNDNRKAQQSIATASTAPPEPKQASYRQRWNGVQLSKTTIVWICLAAIAATMFVGFTWGGWVTSGSAQRTASSAANDAVVQRLAAICVANFQQDSAGEQNLVELKEATTSQQRSYVSEKGWATMPGDEQADNKVAAECAKLLAQRD